MLIKKSYLFALGIVMLTAMMQSCSKGDEGDYGEFSGDVVADGDKAYTDSEYGEAGIGDVVPGEGGGEQGGNTQAGIVTAGEWCDLTNWPFWSGLMLGQEYGPKSDYWKFYTNNRIALHVTDNSGQAVAGVPVKLVRQTADSGASTLWEAVTDNHGRAECWVGLYQKEKPDAQALSVYIDGERMAQKPVICTWDSLQQQAVNEYVITPQTAVEPSADIAFVVDATGSMQDEINFLKSDLVDIIGKAASVRPGTTMRTAALFYRDEGDEYLTRHSDFTKKLSETADFVNKQRADGGGDYPEAVHTALEKMLQNLSWNNRARTRLAFLVLDAPAHYETDVITSLQASVRTCARLGIRLIPVAASGVDKNTEFMLRFFAIATGGTYVFITNDSGVGLDHIAASVGDYKVEQLNDLIIRLIDQYTE